ncbi:MAG: A24 family peptidase [Puniceicoccales bacterium]|jgi:prepilin signal peptidase PulO-like enzyme (type II secretory pathway)|nr:A24 family peptidase [Puniceicoccales bacterium]
MWGLAVASLWGVLLDFGERRAIRSALRFGSLHGISASGIFRGHFRGRSAYPRCGLSAVLQPIVFAATFYYGHGFGAVGTLTMLSILFAAARADIASGTIPIGLIAVAVFSGLIFAAAGPGDGMRLDPILAMEQLREGLLATAALFWLAVIFEALSGKEGMGFGDVQLAGAMGIFIGFRGVVSSFFCAAVFALVVCVVQRFFANSRNRIRFGTPFPFAPYIFFGAALHIVLDAAAPNLLA